MLKLKFAVIAIAFGFIATQEVRASDVADKILQQCLAEFEAQATACIKVHSSIQEEFTERIRKLRRNGDFRGARKLASSCIDELRKETTYWSNQIDDTGLDCEERLLKLSAYSHVKLLFLEWDLVRAEIYDHQDRAIAAIESALFSK